MRKPPAPSRTRLDDLSTGELSAHGASLLSAGNYRDAIDIYKVLLKREPRAEAGWRESLAGAYLERARELAGKAMYREAAVLWKNIPNLCDQSPHPELYVGSLLHSGQHAKAVRAYADHAAALAGAGELDVSLAALALTGQKDVLQALPQDAPPRRQLTAARSALRAYSRGETEDAVREHLKRLPIRSSYRDLRQVLAALLKLENDPAGTSTLVDRIPTTSPYYGWAEIVRACAATEPLRALPALDPASREIASGLLGLEPRQIKLLKEWARLGETPSDKAAFGFITANLAALDQDQARRASLALLPAYPPGLSIHVKLFGPLPPYQSQRRHALKAERDGDLHGGVLLAAVATATDRKAYKKAAGFAARVLELDPINSKARTILINSHLAHARKQILVGKHELAARELDSAARLERDNARGGVVEINRGLLAFTQRQRERARQWLREGVRIAGSPLLARLRLTVAAGFTKPPDRSEIKTPDHGYRAQRAVAGTFSCLPRPTSRNRGNGGRAPTRRPLFTVRRTGGAEKRGQAGIASGQDRGRARFKDEPICYRCGAELSVLLAIEAEAAALEQQAVALLGTGEWVEAHRTVERALTPRSSPLAAAVLDLSHRELVARETQRFEQLPQ